MVLRRLRRHSHSLACRRLGSPSPESHPSLCVFDPPVMASSGTFRVSCATHDSSMRHGPALRPNVADQACRRLGVNTCNPTLCFFGKCLATADHLLRTPYHFSGRNFEMLCTLTMPLRAVPFMSLRSTSRTLHSIAWTLALFRRSMHNPGTTALCTPRSAL